MNQPDLHPLFQTGSIIDDKWVLIERIGRGGMGEIFRAHQLNLDRDVAIKIISEELLQSFEDNPEEKVAAFERLQREVKTMAQVRHPNVLQIFDYGTFQARRNDQAMPVQYIAMEYVPGNTLRFTMSEEGFADELQLLRTWLTKYFVPVLEGVAAIHQSGIVHRDIKPENVLMDGEIPKIADFGLARSVRMRAISNSWDVKGTMNYMAPEQFMDFRKVGPQADIYALGKILYEAVEGKIGPKTIPLKAAKLTATADPLLKKIDAIVQKATSEDLAQRFQTIAELRLAITDALSESPSISSEATRQGKRTKVQVWTRIGIVAALIGLLAMTLWHVLGNPGLVSRSDENPLTGETTPPSALQTESDVKALKTPIRTRDGRTMVLIRPSDAQRSSGSANRVPFYLDRSQVTNHHYLEFLNDVRDRLSVSEGVVRSGDEIWLYLGSGVESYEQIYYKDGRFYLRDAAYAARPVVRVTFYGARAYADHYGKRLPTVAEWRSAAAWLKETMPEHSPPVETGPTRPDQDEHMHMMVQPDSGTSAPSLQPEKAVPSTATLPLVDFGMQLKEWVSNNKPDNGSEARVIDWKLAVTDAPPIDRSPWEGSEHVGFRTLLPINK
jgi:serine/threonine protein kinase